MNEIKNFSFEKKLNYFKNLLNNKDCSEPTDILNIFRLINAHNVFDDNFFEHEQSYINDIAEYIDLRQELKDEIQEFYTHLVFWYLSLIASCDLPLSPIDEKDLKELPSLYFGIFSLGTISLFANIMNKVNNMSIQMNELFKVKNAFTVFGELVSKHAMSAFFLKNI